MKPYWCKPVVFAGALCGHAYAQTPAKSAPSEFRTDKVDAAVKPSLHKQNETPNSRPFVGSGERSGAYLQSKVKVEDLEMTVKSLIEDHALNPKIRALGPIRNQILFPADTLPGDAAIAFSELDMSLAPRLMTDNGVLLKPFKADRIIGVGGEKLPEILKDVRAIRTEKELLVKSWKEQLANGKVTGGWSGDQESVDKLIALIGNLQRTERIIEGGLAPKNGQSPIEQAKIRDGIADLLERNPALRVAYYRPSIETRTSCGEGWTFGDYTGLPMNWKSVCKPTPEMINTVRGVGRISANWKQQPNRKEIGTGFLVGADIVLTNVHVLTDDEAPIIGALDRVAAIHRIRNGCEAKIEFNGEYCPLAQSVVTEVLEVLYVHPSLDAALVRIRSVPGLLPLRLQKARITDSRARNVVVVGFPMWCPEKDKEQCDEVFNGEAPLGVKRVSPGMLVYAGDQTILENEDVIRHDCTTVRGSSGSPVIDLETGNVIAIHFAEDPEDIYQQRIGNFAVRMSSLASDERLRASGVAINWTDNDKKD